MTRLNPLGYRKAKSSDKIRADRIADILDRSGYLNESYGRKLFKQAGYLQGQIYRKRSVNAEQSWWLEHTDRELRKRKIQREHRYYLTQHEQQRIVRVFLRYPYETAEVLVNFISRDTLLRINPNRLTAIVKNILGETPMEFRKRIGIVFRREE